MNSSVTTQSAGGRKQFAGIDLVKFLMALAVVAIHVQAIYVALPLRITDFAAQSFSRDFKWFIELAVPFFFMSTGYLLATRRPDASAVVRRCIKLARLYGSWLLIYLPLSVTYYVVGKYPPRRLCITI